jgi:hypothetical protein
MHQIGSDSAPRSATKDPGNISIFMVLPIMPGKILQRIIIDTPIVLVIRGQDGPGHIPERSKDLPAGTKWAAGNAGTEFFFRHRFCVNETVAGLTDDDNITFPFLGILLLPGCYRGDPMQSEIREGNVLPA